MKLIIFLILPMLLFFSCANKKKTNEKAETIEAPQTEEIIPSEVIKKGYVKAFVKDFLETEEGCGYLLVLEESKQVLQPTQSVPNLIEKDQYKIWLKYRPIRPIAPLFCKKGIPIYVEDLKPR